MISHWGILARGVKGWEVNPQEGGRRYEWSQVDGQEPIEEGHLVRDEGPRGDCPEGSVCSRIQGTNLS